MKDWRDLDSQRFTSFDLIKGVLMLAALGIGLYAVCSLFFPTGSESPAVIVEPISSIPGKTLPEAAPTVVPVRVVGEKASTLGEVIRFGSHAPDFTLEDLDGTIHSLREHQDQVVLINFWTTWCPPCKEEMPALQEVYERFQSQGFLVLGVNWTAVDDPDLVPTYVEELGLSFPILLDKESYVSEELYRLLGLPTSVFVGRDGIVNEVYIGALELDNLENKIQSMLEDTF
jgi:peroxiredoxin